MDNTNYTFEQLWKDLNTGYQIYYTYMDTRYLLSKLKQNYYSKEIVKHNRKNTTSQNPNCNTKISKRNISIYGRYRI